MIHGGLACGEVCGRSGLDQHVDNVLVLVFQAREVAGTRGADCRKQRVLHRGRTDSAIQEVASFI